MIVLGMLNLDISLNNWIQLFSKKIEIHGMGLNVFKNKL